MNVTFHVLTGTAIATTFASRNPTHNKRILLLAGVTATIFLHGVLDYTPHSYPIKSVVDVCLALLLFTIALVGAKPNIRLLIAICFVGSILPDLIDLGPDILNRHFGAQLPEAKWFPWHWKRFSGSVYDGSRTKASVLAHSLVVLTALLLIWRRRDCFRQRSIS